MLIESPPPVVLVLIQACREIALPSTHIESRVPDWLSTLLATGNLLASGENVMVHVCIGRLRRHGDYEAYLLLLSRMAGHFKDVFAVWS